MVSSKLRRPDATARIDGLTSLSRQPMVSRPS